MLLSNCRPNLSSIRGMSIVHPVWSLQSSRELKQPLPPDLPVTREAPTGQVSYLCRAPSPHSDYLTPPGTIQASAVVSGTELFIVSGN